MRERQSQQLATSRIFEPTRISANSGWRSWAAVSRVWGWHGALKRDGVDDFVVLERAEDVGGTWRDNTYPGCQRDVPSTLYSFSFAPNHNWTHTYPLQAEILDYLHAVARHEGLAPHIRFAHGVRGARWDDAAKH